jgi:hypothetical protein
MAYSTQDVLDANETVVDEYDDGSRLVEIEHDGDDEATYRLELHASGRHFDDLGEERARLAFDVYTLVGGFDVPHDIGPIPLPVATEDRRTIAAYLFALEEYSYDDVADALDVQTRTVWDYVSTVRGRARDDSE